MCDENDFDSITLEALQFTSERNHAAHERRVNHELKIVIASITFFTLSAIAKLSNNFSLDDSKLFYPCVLIAFLVLCITTSMYIKSSAQSNQLNLDEARAAEHDILEYLFNHEHCKSLYEYSQKKNTEEIQPPSKDRWKWEIAIICGSAIIAGMIVFEKWLVKLISCFVT